MSIVIHQATSDDLERICALADQSLLPTAAAGKIKHLRRIYDSSSITIVKQKLKRFMHISDHSPIAVAGFVAEENGQFLGHASIETYQTTTWVGDLFVARNARGRGIAGKLADAQMEHLTNFQGKLSTGTVTSLTHSQKVYYSRGFVPIGFQIGWFPNYHDERGQDDSAIMMTQFRYPKLTLPSALYVPPSFIYITTSTINKVFESYGSIPVFDAEKINIPPKELETQLDEKFARISPEQQQNVLIDLQKPTTELVIAYLQNKGYYFSGFAFPFKDEKVRVVAQFSKKTEGIKREDMHIIPEALPIADFIWEQYVKK